MVKMLGRVGGVVAAVGVCLLLSGPAFATSDSLGEVRMTFTKVGPGGNVTIVDHGTSHYTVAGVYNHTLVLHDLTDANEIVKFPTPLEYLRGTYGIVGGGLEGEQVYATAGWPNNKNLATFCADIKQTIGYGQTCTYDVYLPQDAPIGGTNNPNGMGAAKADDLRLLFSLMPSSLDAKKATAFQAAVWEIINEDAGTAYALTGTTKGNLYTTAPAGTDTWVTTANGWLTTVWSYTDPVPDIGLRVLVNPITQDFALVVPGLGSNPIPEPLTLLAFGSAIAGLAGYIRRRRLAQA